MKLNDRAAVIQALLALRRCPECRTELVQAPLGRADEWHCPQCHRTWRRKPS